MPDRQRRKRRSARHAGVWLALAAAGAAVLAAAPAVPAWTALPWGAAGLGLALRALDDRGGVPVMVYHSVSDAPGWLPWAANTSVRVRVFEAHLRVLRRGGWQVLSSRAFQRARMRGDALPRRAVVLHFDDGYLDNHVAAAPLLRRHGMPATIFVSTDFIDPSEGLRPTIAPDAPDALNGPLCWDGYMNARELRALDRDPLFEIACHGTDHARVAIAPEDAHPRPVARLTPEDWRFHAPWLWGQMRGNKARWYRADAPPVACGTPVPQTDSALCAGAWDAAGGAEPDAARRARILGALRRARSELGQVLGREVDFLCWPFDRVTPEALALAREAGFTRFTGGQGQNRADEDAAILSRVHVNDRAAGPGLPLWAEAAVFRARLGVAAGEFWWLPLTWLASRRRARSFAIEYAPPRRGARARGGA